MKRALGLVAAAAAVLAPCAALAGEAPADFAGLAKALVAEDPAVARKAEADLLALGWPAVRELELFKASADLPEADRVALEPRAEAIQRQIEEATWETAMKEAQPKVYLLGADTPKGKERWRIVPRKNPNRLLRKFLKEHVVFAVDCTWITKDGHGMMQRPPVMGKVAVRVGTWEPLKFDRDPAPLFRAERVSPSSPAEAAEAAELFGLLTLDEQFDMERGFERGLKAGGCHVLEKAADLPGADKRPLPPAVADRVAPPSCTSVEGGFEVVQCVWYEDGGSLIRRTLSFRAGVFEKKDETLAENAGAHGVKK